VGFPDARQEDPQQQAYRSHDRGTPEVTQEVKDSSRTNQKAANEESWIAMAERPGESRSDESNSNSINQSNTDRGAAQAAGSGQALHEIRETRGRKEWQAGSRRESAGRSAGAGAVQALQAWLGGYRGADSQRAGHAFCLPVLSEVAPRSRSGARV
jgi:hypothetical protein